ncbi:MAG: pirin family protein [Bacillota bacterium]|nr:pirin family protein [Bacillota bacterium]
MKERTIKRIVNGMPAVDGAGVSLVRALSRPDVPDFDPFLMLDAFDSTDPADYVKGFPWHPHRGIETITYLIAGRIEHGDSLGNRGAIVAGGAQWMTAGRGILHQEMPKASPRMLGAQLWLNLPAKDKMTAPQYRDVEPSSVPVVARDGSTVRILSGTYEGVAGAVHPDHVLMTWLDVDLAPGAVFVQPVGMDETAFSYLFSGSFSVPAGTSAVAKDAALFSDGDMVIVTAGDKGARFLFGAAAPLREPVAWGGPIVMNTREELRKAFEEIDNGTFLKK